jgi:N-acetylmuramoyl-L-alanine amidase CwlA
MKLEEAYEKLNIEERLLPVGASNRPGTPVNLMYLTVHNTQNPAKGADALAHARYMLGPEARKRKVSWHYTVDSERVVKHLPTSEVGWHAGRGNTVSIGIEICENEDGDQDAANERAALLCAVLMFAENIPAARVVTHRNWTKKHCPHLLLDQPGGFTVFRARCAALLAELKKG